MKKVTLSIEGMTCSACSNGLEKYLKSQENIKNASVNLVMATASIECSDDVSIESLEKMVSDAGFKSLGLASLEENRENTNKSPLIIYGIIAIILMYFSMAHMGLPIITLLNMQEYPINYSVCLLLLTLPFIFYGFDIIKNGIKNLIHKMPNMDTLVSLGVITSFLYSVFGVILIILGFSNNVENLYFESVAFVIYFVKLGRFIDNNAHEKTKSAIGKLVQVTPKYAKIKTEEGIKEVTIETINVGDVLIAQNGDKIAVDGVIVSGSTHCDESFITGESIPVKKEINDRVIAGSINYDGVILYKAEKIGRNSAISEIVKLVIEATNTKSESSRLADKICSYFVPIIMIIALFTFLISIIFNGSLSVSLTRFVTVLVVACPCALGLATPLAVVVSVGVCANAGILVKSSEILEKFSKIDTIVFDKTGTLTSGYLKINKIYNYSKYQDKELLSIIGAIENNSSHPIAKGIVASINEMSINIKDAEYIKNIDGLGIRGKVGKNEYFLGNKKIVEKLKIKNDYLKQESDLSSNGNSIVYIIENKKIIGLIGVKDTIKDNVKSLIKKLKKENIEVIMLTGDNENTAKNIGKILGIDNIIADVLPKEKNQVIKDLKSKNHIVAMVGDGINDAPSLVSADIGVSLSSATDIATNSADVVILNNNLVSIIDLINISKKTLKNIKENLFWAFLYNVCMIPIASGLFSRFNLEINPMFASLAMILSSMIVAFNALRLKRINVTN